MTDFSSIDTFMEAVENTIANPLKGDKNKKYLVGVDLGTAYTVLVVLDEDKKPVCTRLRRTHIVRDGLVVDYLGAKKVVAELKEEAEKAMGVELFEASIAVPPGTGTGDSRTHQYVVEGAGLRVVEIVDEPTAANQVLGIKNGAVVDIGGGTTGISIFKDGNVVFTADEATGGTHFTYVLAGHYKIPFDEADKMKVDQAKHKDVFPVVIPVAQKVASIIKKCVAGYDVDRIVLCGGTSCLKGIEKIIAVDSGIHTEKPKNPFLVTPVGIALSHNLKDNNNSYGGIYDID